MGIEINGNFLKGVYVKDIILYLIVMYGVVFGIGYVVEYYGEIICNMLMEEWMMICNMVIEGGVKMGMMVLDEIIFEYVCGCEYVFVDMDKVISDWKMF